MKAAKIVERRTTDIVTTQERRDSRDVYGRSRTVSHDDACNAPGGACDELHMTALGLLDAARRAGVHRSTLHRQVKAGRLSATRTEGGDFRVDLSELLRLYPQAARDAEPPDPPRQRAQGRAQDDATASATDTTGATSLHVRVASLEGALEARATEVRLLQQMLTDLKAERDDWKGQAQRLALPPPRRPWWSWRR